VKAFEIKLSQGAQARQGRRSFPAAEVTAKSRDPRQFPRARTRSAPTAIATAANVGELLDQVHYIRTLTGRAGGHQDRGRRLEIPERHAENILTRGLEIRARLSW
jgi:hypothetical protein